MLIMYYVFLCKNQVRYKIFVPQCINFMRQSLCISNLKSFFSGHTIKLAVFLLTFEIIKLHRSSIGVKNQ